VCDIDRFVSSFLKSASGGLARVLNPTRRDESLVLIRRLIELFARIDTTGNGRITWDQFTSFAAENTLSGGTSTGKTQASFVYRDSDRLQVPQEQDVPLTRVTCMKWVPELQQLFVTYQNYPTVFIFSHLFRLVARLHANMPPPDAAVGGAANLVSERARASIAEQYRERLDLREAMETTKFDTLGWAEGNYGGGGAGRRGGREEAAEEEETGSVRAARLDRENAEMEEMNAADSSASAGPTHAKSNAAVAEAQKLLKSRCALAPGQRMRAAVTLANARSEAESRKAALLTELGTAIKKEGSSALSLTQQRAVEAEVKAAQAGGSTKRPTTAPAGQSFKMELNPALAEKVFDVVRSRGAEAAARKSSELERASAQAVLLAHPAGFTMGQAERLKKTSMADLGEASASMLESFGVKSKGSASWGKTKKLLQAGMGSTAVKPGAGNARTETLEESSGGRPQAASSAAMVAYDPGPNGRARDYGFAIDTSSRKEGDKGGGGKEEAALPGTATGAMKSRTDLLATAKGTGVGEVTLLGVAYCMPVSRTLAEDPKHWRSIRAADVSHILAVSSSELVITLWSTRTLTYNGVIHVLLPQDRMAWATGANLLLSCNSYAGPVVAWDVLTGSKVTMMDAHAAPVLALLDCSAAGMICAGSLDATISVWGYRNDSELMGGDLAGIRGRAPPRKPALTMKLVGHTAGILYMAVTESPLQPRLISSGMGSELCIWDLNSHVMLSRVSSTGRDTSVNALAVTGGAAPYAITVDEGCTVRLWSTETSGSGSAYLDQLDAYRVPDMPMNAFSTIAVPLPHPHIVVGGRRVTLMAPAQPGSDGSGSGSLTVGLAPVAALYAPELAAFLVAEGTNVIVWDARTSAIKRRLQGVTPQMIVSFALDPSGRKVLVGDAGGELVTINILDGRVLARATNPHTDDVTRVVVMHPADGVTLTSSWDRSIRVWATGRDTGVKVGVIPCVRLVENAHAADITAMDASRALGLVASGAADGTLRLWDFCSFELSSVLKGHTAGVTAVAFPGPDVLPLLVSADDSGCIHVYAVKGSSYHDRLILVLHNLGLRSGPPPPSLKVVDLSVTQAEERRYRTGKMQGGLLSIVTKPGAKVESGADGDMAALFATRRVENFGAQRVVGLKGIIAHASEAASSGHGLALPRTAASPLASSSASGGGSSPHSPAVGASRLPASPSRGPDPIDLTSVPISCLAVRCVAGAGGAVSFAVFTGDGQGVVKRWDLSQLMVAFGDGGNTGITLMPPSRYACNLMAWNATASKHRVFPDESPVAYDPAEEAKAASLAAALRALGTRPGARVPAGPSADADRMKGVLAQLKSRRERYSSLHPIKASRAPIVPLGTHIEGLNRLERQYLEEDQIRDRAEAAKAEEERLKSVIAFNARVAAAQEEAEAERVAQALRASDIRRASLSNVPGSAAAASAATASLTSPVTPKRGSGLHGSPAGSPTAPEDVPGLGSSSDSPPQKSGPPVWPKVSAFLGAVVQDEITARESRKPLLPALVSPREGPGKRSVSPSHAEPLHLPSSAGRKRGEVARAPIGALAASLPQSIQDELWYTFTSSSPAYIAAAEDARRLAEGEAATRGWSDGVEGGEAKFKVPDAAWVASRTRTDILPAAVWTAHTDTITSITFVDDPVAVLTTSLDVSTRLWTPTGLPIGVISAAARNMDMERALKAASQLAAAAAEARGDVFVPPTPNLQKEDCLWQFVPNDEEAIFTATKLASAILSRLTTFKPNRRASVQLVDADGRIPGADQEGVGTRPPEVSAALGKVYAMGRRASVAAAELAAASDVSVLAAKAATVAAEAAATVAGRDPALADDGDGPGSEAASAALNTALISAIESWDKDASGPVERSAGASSRRVEEGDMLKRYSHMGAEVGRRAAEVARKNDAGGLDAAMKEMREAGLLPALPARPATAAPTPRAPPSSPPTSRAPTATGAYKAPTSPAAAHLASAASRLRVSSAAAAAGFDLEAALGVGGQGSDGPLMAVAAVRAFPIRPAMRAAEESGARRSGEEEEKESAPLAPTASERLASALARARTVLSSPAGGPKAVRSHMRPRASELIAAAEEWERGETGVARPSTASARLHASSALQALLGASSTLISTKLEDMPAIDVFGGGARPSTASSSTPWKQAGRDSTPCPPGLPPWAVILHPFADYVPPRGFAMYARATVDKFRDTWADLDTDGSGQVDIEELLNAKVFSANTLKVTKALFGTIDEDKSGTVSLKEMLRVAFPLADSATRSSISRYIRYEEAKVRAEDMRARAGLEASASSPAPAEVKPAASGRPSSSAPAGRPASAHARVAGRGGVVLSVLERSRASRASRSMNMRAVEGEGEAEGKVE